MATEEWRDAPGYEGLYSVSNLGRVRNSRGRVLTGHIRSDGRRIVTLSKDGVVKYVKVYRLVCEAFHGPPPEGAGWALHINDLADDDRAENLRWGAPKENRSDALRNGSPPERRSVLGRARSDVRAESPILPTRLAAEYCGVSLRQFRAHAPALGLRPFQFMGKWMYRVADLDSVLEETWRRSIGEGSPGISAGSTRTIAGTGIRLAESRLLKPGQLLLSTASGS